jgi:hypothetical protein
MMGGRTPELAWWLTLIASVGAILFPDLVLAESFFADSFIDRRTIRPIAIPLFVVSAVLLSDYHLHWFHWSK